MALPIVSVSNGLPVTESANGLGIPVEIAANGLGMPVTFVASGGAPVVSTGTWSPAELFKTGQGIWYQPDPAYLYSGRTGTTPSVVGGPVGQMLDRSGGNRHAVAPSDSARPTLRQNAAGLYYLEFDGVDDYMVVDGAALVNVEYYLGAAWAPTGTNQPTVYGGAGQAGNQNLFFGWRNASVAVLGQYANDLDASGQSNPLVPDVWSGLLDSTGHKIRRAGGQLVSNTNTAKVVNLPGFTIGRLFSLCTAITFYGGILMGRSLTAGELAQTEGWLATRIGKALPRSISYSGSGYAGSVYTSSAAGQWTADGVAIAGATGATYTLTLADEGKAIRCADSNTIEMWVASDLGALLVADMDARDPASVTLATGVASWKSRSGVTYELAQGNTGLQPTYTAGQNVSFAGNQLFGVNPAWPAVYDVVVAGQPNAAGQWRTLFWAGNSQHPLIINSGDTRLGYYSAAFVQAGALEWPAQPGIACVRVPASKTPSMSRDGGALIAGTTALAAQAPSVVGSASGGGQPFGSLHGFVLTNAAMSADQLARTEGLLAWRHGMQARLDAAHPYKSAPPRVQ